MILTPGEEKHEYFMQKEYQNEHAYLLDESNIGSCRQVEFLCVLVRMGFLVDKRVERLIDAFIEKSRFDGGYLCKWKKSHFSEIDKFTENLFKITKYNGKIILSDFHPFRKTNPESTAYQTGGDYFDSKIHMGDVAYKSLFPEEDADGFPDCSLRFYTLSEIINSVIKAGFVINEFNEHPNCNNRKLPGEFTIIADKIQ